jgi:hypothetical protein
MWAAVGIDAGTGQLKALHRPTVDEVFLHDFFCVFRMNKPVPDRLWINNEHSGMLALVEASSRVDPNAVLQTGLLYGVLEGTAELFAVLVGAAGTGCGGISFV